MPIKVSCHCGQSFMAKDELKGQTLLCPKCHQPITIGEGAKTKGAQREASGIEELFEEAGIEEVKGARCPRCMSGLKPHAVMCVACGYNLQTGEKVEAAKVRKAGERGHGEAADVLLELAAERIKDDKLEELKTRKQGLPAWVYALLLIGLSCFVVAMFMIPKNQAFEITGWIIVGFGGLCGVYMYIRMIVSAFFEDRTCGLLFLFLPPVYPLYYLFTRWDIVGTFFLMILASICVSGVGFAMVAMAPLLKEKSEGPGAFNPASQLVPQYAAVVAATESELWTV